MHCQAAMASTSFMGARVQRAQPVSRVARVAKGKGMVVKAMFERFTEKVGNKLWCCPHGHQRDSPGTSCHLLD